MKNNKNEQYVIASLYMLKLLSQKWYCCYVNDDDLFEL